MSKLTLQSMNQIIVKCENIKCPKNRLDATYEQYLKHFKECLDIKCSLNCGTFIESIE